MAKVCTCSKSSVNPVSFLSPMYLTWCRCRSDGDTPLSVLPAPDRFASLATASVLPTLDAQLVALAITSVARTPTVATTLYPGLPVSAQPQAPTQHQGMILASILQPVPAPLVRCIRAGEFVEIRDLLSDNEALHDHLEATQDPIINAVTPDALRPQVREVLSLIL